jgi:hypothetical protein
MNQYACLLSVSFVALLVVSSPGCEKEAAGPQVAPKGVEAAVALLDPPCEDVSDHALALHPPDKRVGRAVFVELCSSRTTPVHPRCVMAAKTFEAFLACEHVPVTADLPPTTAPLVPASTTGYPALTEEELGRGREVLERAGEPCFRDELKRNTNVSSIVKFEYTLVVEQGQARGVDFMFENRGEMGRCMNEKVKTLRWKAMGPSDGRSRIDEGIDYSRVRQAGEVPRTVLEPTLSSPDPAG